LETSLFRQLDYQPNSQQPGENTHKTTMTTATLRQTDPSWEKTCNYSHKDNRHYTSS